MTERDSLKTGRRRLAAELRRQREAASLTVEGVGAQLGWSGSKVSRIERNRTEVKPSDLTILLDLYGVSGTLRSDLIALAVAQRSKGWWVAYSDVTTADYAAYIELETEAENLLSWSPQTVHGLLQTESYARAVIEASLQWNPATPPGRIQRLVNVRLSRQRIVTDSGSLALSVVLDQSVLLRKIGDATVMSTQLASLVNVSQRPNVTVRVLPFAGSHPIMTGSFSLLTFPSVLDTGPSPSLVYVEQLGRTALYIEDEGEVFEYSLAFQELCKKSLDPDRSRDLIAATAAETWSNPGGDN